MAAIPTMLGFGDKGMNWEASGTNVRSPVTDAQATGAYIKADAGLDQQMELYKALQAQGGIANQSNVFNQQQGLANQLQAQSMGQGPNVAQNMLDQATGQNVANQAALMASQRGAGANVGLLARQAAIAGGNIEQQAAGQGAIMRAQQQVAAQQALGGQQAQMANMANQQVGQQAAALQGYNQAAQGLQGNLLNSIGGVNNANVGMQSNMNSANSGVQQQIAKTQGETINKMFDSMSGTSAQQGMGGGGGGGGGGMMGMAAMASDERNKTDIKPADGKIEEFLDKTGAHSFKYKDEAKNIPHAGKGEYVAPMAQELEQSEIGKSMVSDTPNGKEVDYGKAFGAIMASLSHLNKRLDAQDGGKKAKNFAEGGSVDEQQGPANLSAAVSESMNSHFPQAAGAIPIPQDTSPPAPTNAINNTGGGLGGFIGGALRAGSNALGITTPQVTVNAAPAPTMTGYMMGTQVAAPTPIQADTRIAPPLADTPKKDGKEDKGGLGGFVGGGASSGASSMMAMNKGGKVDHSKPIPGKAKVKGDDIRNDTVKAKLSPGEVVLPRSVMNSKDPARSASDFVNAIIAKKGLKR